VVLTGVDFFGRGRTGVEWMAYARRRMGMNFEKKNSKQDSYSTKTKEKLAG
jgi:hypothetical protein